MKRNTNGSAVLEVDGLSVWIRIRGQLVQALNDVSLTIRRGEVLGLVGESGSGKSLTALSIARLLPDNARIHGGSIRLMGEDVLAKDEQALDRMRARALALIFQNPTTYLNPVLTVGEQIAEIFELNPELLGSTSETGSLSRRERRGLAWRKSSEYLGLVKIPDPDRIVRQYPFQLSGGMQQRVVIAMALARQPSLIIADEITTALDVTIQAQILTLLSELRRAIGMTLLLITHDMGIVAQLADRVAVMYSGSIVECADVRSVFKDAHHPYSRALLETVPTIDATQTSFRPIPGAVPTLTDPPSGCRFHPRCSYALDACRTVRPVTVSAGPGHTVACHRFGDLDR